MNSNDFDSHEKSSTLVCDLITGLKAVSDRKRREFSPHIICAHLTTGPFVQSEVDLSQTATVQTSQTLPRYFTGYVKTCWWH